MVPTPHKSNPARTAAKAENCAPSAAPWRGHDPVKQYQLYVKLEGPGIAPWSYCDTYSSPRLAWCAQLLARNRGCKTRIVTAPAVQVDESVIANV